MYFWHGCVKFLSLRIADFADFTVFASESPITPNQRYECHLGIPRITRMNADKIPALGFLVRPCLSSAITPHVCYLCYL